MIRSGRAGLPLPDATQIKTRKVREGAPANVPLAGVSRVASTTVRSMRVTSGVGVRVGVTEDAGAAFEPPSSAHALSATATKVSSAQNAAASARHGVVPQNPVIEGPAHDKTYFVRV